MTGVGMKIAWLKTLNSVGRLYFNHYLLRVVNRSKNSVTFCTGGTYVWDYQ